MATFEQRESGYWQAKIRRKGYPKLSKSFRTKALAESWARVVEAEMDRGVFTSRAEADRTSISDLAKLYTTWAVTNGHYKGVGWKIKLAHVVERLGDYSLSATTPVVISGYREARLSDPDPRYKDPTSAPRISGATVKTELDLLSKMMEVAVKELRIPLPLGNPVRSITKPRDSEARARRLTTEEWAKLEAACKASQNAWLHPALMLSVETAMRQGEVLGLQWSAVDLNKQLAFLAGAATKNNRARKVPLSSRAVSLLEGLPRHTSGRVIPIEKQTLASAFRTATRRASVSDYRWHDIRHEALSRLAEKGLSVAELATVSGHRTWKLLERYVHNDEMALARKI